MMTWVSALVTVAVLGYLYIPSTQGYFGLTSGEPFVAVVLDLEDNHTAGRELLMQGPISNSDLCDALMLQRRQRKMCRGGDGLGQTLVAARRLAVVQCQDQYGDERWNCSLQHRLNVLKKGFKETAFLHAVTSAGLVYSFARACSQGSLERCTCDESLNGDISKNRETWLWGGCGDNIRYGLKFTKRFLKSRRWNKDLRGRVDRHNSNVGIRSVRRSVQKTCKCHGVSASCTVKTCWRQLAPFYRTGSDIKQKSSNAKIVNVSTNQATGKSQLRKKRRGSVALALRRGDMVFIDSSPNYCSKTPYSDGTIGRACRKGSSCDTLCCGRGYNVITKTVAKRCHCQVIWCCKVKCQTCYIEEKFYICK